MMFLAGLLLATSLTLPADTTTLVLRSGQRIAVDGPVREEKGRIVFRAEGGALYSIAASDIDVRRTRNASSVAPAVPRRETVVSGPADEKLKLRVTDTERQRLLRELEQNHSGQPAPDQILLSRPPEPLTKAEEAAQTKEEWSWRTRARSYEEGVRRARENLTLLESRVAELRSRIAGFVSLGYKPSQFTYDTAVLQTTIEQIPYAELEVTRAQREYDQFREDARRQGVMPGWLR